MVKGSFLLDFASSDKNSVNLYFYENSHKNYRAL